MPCPSCGGTAREAIAPGWWRCLSTVTFSGPGPGAGAPPGGRFGPATVSSSSVCGNTYAEAGEGSPMNTATCSCGTFAIGICTECGEPVCGNCSVVSGGKRIHRTLARKRAAAQADLAAQATRVTEEAREREREEDEAALQAVKDRVFEIGRELGRRRAPGSVKVRLRDKRGMSDKGPWTVWPLMEMTPPMPSSGTDHAYQGGAPTPRMIGVDANGKLVEIYGRSWLMPDRGHGLPVGRPWMDERDFRWKELLEAAERLAFRRLQ
jgi:hypothetical protein